MPETNKRPGRCGRCSFAVQPGEGKYADKTLFHTDPKVCQELKEREAARQREALRRKQLRHRIVERILHQGA
jgi:hypothetical protein